MILRNIELIALPRDILPNKAKNVPAIIIMLFLYIPIFNEFNISEILVF